MSHGTQDGCTVSLVQVSASRQQALACWSVTSNSARFGGLFRAALFPICLPIASLERWRALIPLHLLMALKRYPLMRQQRVGAPAWSDAQGVRRKRYLRGGSATETSQGAKLLETLKSGDVVI